MRFVLFSFFILISVVCCAAVYMTEDQDGTTTYSDVPTEHAKVVDLDSSQEGISTINTMQTEKKIKEEAVLSKNPGSEVKGDKKESKESSEPKPAVRLPYQSFVMTNPVDQQTYQNDRSIPVDFKTEPELQKGDMVQVYVDGNAAGGPRAATHVEISGLNRGSHQFYGVLMDEQRTVLKRTAPITIFIHYTSAITGPAFKQPI